MTESPAHANRHLPRVVGFPGHIEWLIPSEECLGQTDSDSALHRKPQDDCKDFPRSGICPQPVISAKAGTHIYNVWSLTFAKR